MTTPASRGRERRAVRLLFYGSAFAGGVYCGVEGMSAWDTLKWCVLFGVPASILRQCAAKLAEPTK